jgi:outer membrane protein assembly factor BamB
LKPLYEQTAGSKDILLKGKIVIKLYNGGRYLIQKRMVIGVILLFITSSVTPMVVGFHNKTSDRNTLLNDGADFFNCYHNPDSISSPSLVYVEEKPQYEQAVNVVSKSSGDGLMNSSWPMYCHDIKHTGRSPYNTSENPMKELWRYSVYGYSSHCAPVLDAEGTIYVADSHICAIYPNGTLKWKFIYGSPVEGCPAIDEQRGVLYYGIEWDSPNYLYALYLTNGSTKWKYQAYGDVDSSPAIDDDGVIYFGDWHGFVHAVYPNGTRKWIYHVNKTGDVITSSPAIGDDGTIYIGCHDNYFYAFYPNGTIKWRFQTGSWVHASPTIGPDGTIYIGSDDNYLYALNPENGSMIWRCSIGGTWCSPALGSDGTLYLGTWQKNFYAIRPNGTIKWTYQAPGRIWFGASAALSNDGILYFGTTWMDGGEGAFVALNASDGHQRFIDYYGWYTTSPAIAYDGTVYAVSTDIDSFYGILHAFGSGEPKKIEIQQPEKGKLYFFGLGMYNTLLGITVIIGSVPVKVNVYSVNEIESVHFYIDGTDYYNRTTSPFRWRMNHRYGDSFLSILHTLTVTAYYKGGCSWTESMDVMYFHLLGN